MIINIIAVLILLIAIGFWARVLFFFLWIKMFGKSKNIVGYDSGAENYSKGDSDSQGQ